MGSFLRPGGLGSDRVSAAGEEKPSRLEQENSAPKTALPYTGYFVAPHPVCLTYKKNNNRNNEEITIISRLQPFLRRAQEPPGDLF